MTLPREPRIHPVSILTLALHQEGVKSIATTVVADLRRLPRAAFWIYLDNRGWLHPFDALVRAFKLAKSGEADYLPGWCGPIARA